MANPRQRRKAKSNHRPISHSRRAKRLQKKIPPIRGPKTLVAKWDKTKTVRQNYVALGLLHTLDPIASGGAEVQIKKASGAKTDGASNEIPMKFGKIVRDESGAVIKLELPEEEEGAAIEEMEMLEAVVPDVEQRMWANGVAERGNGFIKELERLADGKKTCQRHTSVGERLYLARLAQKYGDDYESMARDRRLNPAQRTAGQMRRAIAKARGCSALIGQTDMSVAGPSLHKAKLRDVVTSDVTPGT